MTPILIGRWQTRFLLLCSAGLLVTLAFGYIYHDYITPLAVLGYVLLFGFVWDMLYHIVQTTYRWDQDWPPTFQLATGITEGLFVWAGILLWDQFQWFGWSHLPAIGSELTLAMFVAHYAVVWVIIFLATQGPLRIIFPRWRYDGGRWI